MTKSSHWASELASSASFGLLFRNRHISTVGYGNIIPHSSLTRVLASLEVFCGIMLLLFGMSEMLKYARERARIGVTIKERLPERRYHCAHMDHSQRSNAGRF